MQKAILSDVVTDLVSKHGLTTLANNLDIDKADLCRFKNGEKGIVRAKLTARTSVRAAGTNTVGMMRRARRKGSHRTSGGNVMTETWYRKLCNGTETIEVQGGLRMGTGKWVRCSERNPDVCKKYLCIRDGEEYYLTWFPESRAWGYPTTNEAAKSPDYWLDPPSQPSPALKPCPNPSCKSNHVRVAEHPFDGSVYGVYCLECVMAGPRHKIKWDAITLWNALPR